MAEKLGGDGGNVEDPVGVSPLGGQKHCGDDRETCDGQDVRISPSGGSTISSRLIHHTRVYSESAVDHCGTGDMLTHL